MSTAAAAEEEDEEEEEEEEEEEAAPELLAAAACLEAEGGCSTAEGAARRHLNPPAVSVLPDNTCRSSLIGGC